MTTFINFLEKVFSKYYALVFFVFLFQAEMIRAEIGKSKLSAIINILAMVFFVIWSFINISVSVCVRNGFIFKNKCDWDNDNTALLLTLVLFSVALVVSPTPLPILIFCITVGVGVIQWNSVKNKKRYDHHCLKQQSLRWF